MAVTVLSFISDGNVDYHWPGAYVDDAYSDLDTGAEYEVSSFGQDTAAILIFEWGQGFQPDQMAAVLEDWTEYASRAGLRPGPAPFGPKLGSQTAGGIEGFRYSVVGGASGGLGVKT